jgi:hypothetical protein
MLSRAVTWRNNERGQERSGTARNQIRTDSQDMPAALTDKAGAGKTFVAISLVCKDIERKAGVYRSSSATDYFSAMESGSSLPT